MMEIQRLRPTRIIWVCPGIWFVFCFRLRLNPNPNPGNIYCYYICRTLILQTRIILWFYDNIHLTIKIVLEPASQPAILNLMQYLIEISFQQIVDQKMYFRDCVQVWLVINLWNFPHVISSPNCLTYCFAPTCFENMFCLLPWHCPALLFWSPRVFQSLQFSVPKYLHHAAVRTSEGGCTLNAST